MFTRIKILALPLLLAAILGVLSFAGCGGKLGDDGNGGGDLTQPELEQVMADSMAAYRDAASYGFTYDMDMNLEMVGGSSPGTMEMTMRGEGEADIDANTMLMNMDVSLKSDVPDMEGSQEMSADIYLLTDWMYMKMKVTGLGEQWVKTPVTEDVKEAYNLNIVDQQLMPLESMGEIKFIKYQSVDGSQCYVLDIIPDIDAVKAWLDAQELTSGQDWDMLIEDMFNELSYTVWIDTDTNLLKKMSMVMDMDLTAEQVGADETDFDTMSMHMELQMTLGDYNEPVTIDLPDEALDAEEM
jgi:hypothetical protein